jgi:hypothetical protein
MSEDREAALGTREVETLVQSSLATARRRAAIGNLDTVEEAFQRVCGREIAEEVAFGCRQLDCGKQLYAVSLARR